MLVRYASGMRPARPPLGPHLARAARTVSRAFDEALAGAGGSLPLWQVLVNLKANPTSSQREIADAMGVTEATLTHHLNAMDADGLLTRRRDPDNRRVHVVELTERGEEVFLRLRGVAMAFDKRLRRGTTEAEVEQLRGLLDRLVANVGAVVDDRSPWADPIRP
jgi:MarR family transcriptional regulator, transcriptional regulator for hemolysin